MIIKQATIEMLPSVSMIVQDTIDKIYPRYYPNGAVDFFKDHHSDDNILADIKNGNVYLLMENARQIGTVTITDNHILRLFVLEQHQHKGYGRALLDFAEERILRTYSKIEIDASFPAKSMYLKRGYIEKEYNRIQTNNGDYLCYDVMTKS